MNTKLLLVTAATLLVSGCSIFSDDEPELRANIQPHVKHLISNPKRKVSIQGAADSTGG